MGLDWCVLPRVEDGMEPAAVPRARRLSRGDPETIQVFKAHWELWQNQDLWKLWHNQANWKGRPPRQPPRQGLSGAVARLLGRRPPPAPPEPIQEAAGQETAGDAPEAEAAKWRGSFDDVLERALARKPVPIIVFPSDDDRKEGTPYHLSNIDDYGFRGKFLDERENEISAWLVSSPHELFELVHEIYHSHPPHEMLKLADRLERALAAYRAVHPEPDEPSVEAYEDAIRWLRFWAGRGFSYLADF